MTMKVLILTADGFEDLELFYPYYRVVSTAMFRKNGTVTYFNCAG